MQPFHSAFKTVPFCIAGDTHYHLIFPKNVPNVHKEILVPYWKLPFMNDGSSHEGKDYQYYLEINIAQISQTGLCWHTTACSHPDPVFNSCVATILYSIFVVCIKCPRDQWGYFFRQYRLPEVKTCLDTLLLFHCIFPPPPLLISVQWLAVKNCVWLLQGFQNRVVFF